MQGRSPDGLTVIKLKVGSPPSVQTHRAAFEEQALAQRIRNSSAVVRAQQKIARERRKPGPQPK
jgi:hypothetical protein